MSKKQEQVKDANEVKGFLKWVENVGNKLPHPAMIFLILSGIIILLSGLGSALGWSVEYFDGRAGEQKLVEVFSLLNADGLRYIFNSATSNYIGFAPLGTVLVAMLGVGVAEASGLLNISLKKLMTGVPPTLLTSVVVFAGIMSNVASDAGYVVVIPLGAMLFAAADRHPIAGLAAAFAGVSGGFSANLILGTTDPLLQGITNQALSSAGINYEMQATGNMYFMMVSTILLTVVGTFVTEKIVVKNLGEYTGTFKPDNEPVTDLENKGLKNAGIALLIFAIVMGVFMFAPQPFGIFKEANAEGIVNITNFLNNGLLLMILLAFLIPGYIYGRTTGSMPDHKALIAGMTDGMKGMSGYLVLSFFAAQFVSYFGKTNLGTMLSVKGAEFLETIGLGGLPLLILFILFAAFINLFMGSASAKWAIMAPIFVPMFYEIGLSPELTQLAYRIGDSTTNIITPLMSYFAMIVVFAQRYDEDSGMGTIISTMLPYSAFFLISWTLLMIGWYLLGIPIGPGAMLHV